METAERDRKVKQLVRQIQAEARMYKLDPERTALHIAELAANIVDLHAGRDSYAVGRTPIGTVCYGARGSTTRKVRKALGYTYP